MTEDVYKWWSKKELKNEILKLKLTYNELFDAMLRTQEENREFQKKIKIIDDANINLRANIKDLRKQFNDRSYVRLEEQFTDLEAQVEKMKCYLPVDERDNDHKWFAYKNLFDTEWKIDYSVQGRLPKCNTIKWLENKEAVMFYLVSNGMKYYEEPRR